MLTRERERLAWMAQGFTHHLYMERILDCRKYTNCGSRCLGPILFPADYPQRRCQNSGNMGTIIRFDSRRSNR